MGLIRKIERATDRLNAWADSQRDAMDPSRAGQPRSTVASEGWCEPSGPAREAPAPRTLSEEDINGFLEASGQRPDPSMGRVDSDEFMRRMRTSAEHRRVRRLERDYAWLMKEARLAGVPTEEMGDLL